MRRGELVVGELGMRTIIVTGGAGFIGSNFVRHILQETESNVVVVDKLSYSGHPANLEEVRASPRFAFVKADIADRPAIEDLFRNHSPDALVNFAAETHVDRSIDDPGPFVQTNLLGTYVLLDVARCFWRDAAADARNRFRFLHVSTDEVYGSLGKSGSFSETTSYAPNSPYAASKAGADHLVRAYHETYGLPALITNCSNNYGPFQFPEKLIPLMILNAVEGKPLPIYGDGGNVRDWLFVLDHCDGILRVLDKGVPGQNYNIGGSNERTNLQVVDLICALLERSVPSAENSALRARGAAAYEDLKVHVDDRPGHDRRYAIDARKIRQDLGWAPRHDFERGMAETVCWYLEHREWCGTVQAGRYGRERLGLAGTVGASL
jgi:dTDP-glucose 4,6-dehydratase